MTRDVKVFGIIVFLSAVLLIFVHWSLPKQNTSAIVRPTFGWKQMLSGTVNQNMLSKTVTTAGSDGLEMPFRGRRYLTEDELSERNNIKNISKMAHAKYSRFFIQGRKTNIRLGDKIQVWIDLYDSYDRRRLIGGDYLRLWMENIELKAYVAGEVFDHNNGSYTGFVKALWVGKGVIRVFIARRREEIALYYTLYKEYTSIWDVQARFANGEIAESTSCSILQFNKTKHFCNLTSLNWNFPWYCEKPSNPKLTCDTWQKINSLRRSNIGLTPQQRALFKWSINYTVDFLPKRETIDIHEKDTQEINDLRVTQTSCSKVPPEVTWQRQQPNGFFHNDIWRPNLCTNTLNKTTKAYRECLRNKTLWLTGDSTSEQFYRAILHMLKIHYKRGATAHQPKHAWNKEYNATVNWFAHELPFYHGPVLHNRSVNIAEHTVLDNLTNTSEDIVVLYIYVHIMLVHPDVFRRHVQRYVISAKNALRRAPRVTIAVRGPHTFYRSGEFGLLSYWGLVYTDILHEEFSSIKDKVIYLDFWDMTVAKPSYNVHYPGPAINQMVHNMMSFLCFRNLKLR